MLIRANSIGGVDKPISRVFPLFIYLILVVVDIMGVPDVVLHECRAHVGARIFGLYHSRGCGIANYTPTLTCISFNRQ